MKKINEYVFLGKFDVVFIELFRMKYIYLKVCIHFQLILLIIVTLVRVLCASKEMTESTFQREGSWVTEINHCIACYQNTEYFIHKPFFFKITSSSDIPLSLSPFYFKSIINDIFAVDRSLNIYSAFYLKCEG